VRYASSLQFKDSANICNSSDADADVLAEYVIALLKHDGDADAVRKLCEQEIPDFLSEGAHCYCHFWDDCSQKLTANQFHRSQSFPRRRLPSNRIQILPPRCSSSSKDRSPTSTATFDRQHDTEWLKKERFLRSRRIRPSRWIREFQP
jgi:hypothetical protein